MPPPCCMVMAPSSKARRCRGSKSSIGPITKQLNSVTLRSVPAPAWMRPPGKNLKSSQNTEEALLPGRLVFRLDHRKRTGDAAPGIGDRTSPARSGTSPPRRAARSQRRLVPSSRNSETRFDARQGSFPSCALVLYSSPSAASATPALLLKEGPVSPRQGLSLYSVPIVNASS